MASEILAILHPGEMGAAVGACARRRGAHVLWASAGRSRATAARAGAAGLEDAGTLEGVVARSRLVLSVCPPHGAVAVARAVAARGFRGVFVDANAVSPATARQIGRVVEGGGAAFVDGGLVGPPPADGGPGTRLYLAGAAAPIVAEAFRDTALEVQVLDGPAGAASALKAGYAAWTKGGTALVAAVLALAAREGVGGALAAEWARSQPEALRRMEGVRTSARKAWRWVGEMEEIGGAFAAAGLPDGFARAAAEVYRRLAPYRDGAGPPAAEAVIQSLLDGPPGAGPPAGRP